MISAGIKEITFEIITANNYDDRETKVITTSRICFTKVKLCLGAISTSILEAPKFTQKFNRKVEQFIQLYQFQANGDGHCAKQYEYPMYFRPFGIYSFLANATILEE